MNWRIFKRARSPFWQIQFQRQGKRYAHSLGEVSKKAAIETAKVKIDLWRAGRLADLRRSMERPGTQAFSTVGELVSLVEAPATVDRWLAIVAKPAARHNYCQGLLWCLRQVFPDGDPAKLSLAALADDTGKRFFDLGERHAALAGTQADANRIRFRFLAMHRHARALLAPGTVASMRELGLRIPDPTPFRTPAKLALFKRARPAEFVLPSRDILRRTLQEWVKMARQDCPTLRRRASDLALSEIERRNVFLTIGLELSCGLRKNEVRQAKWGWISEERGVPILRASPDVSVKNRSARLVVVPLEPYWSMLNWAIDRYGWRGQPGEYILAERPKGRGAGRFRSVEGGPSDRIYWPFHYVGHFLRSMGWETAKTNHALRDWSASQIVMKWGLDRACRWCRHANLATTEKSYSHFVLDTVIQSENPLPWLRFAGSRRPTR